MWIIDFVNEKAVKEFEDLPNDIKARLSNKRILILATAIKKKNKLSKSIMKLAISRLKEFKNGNN